MKILVLVMALMVVAGCKQEAPENGVVSQGVNHFGEAQRLRYEEGMLALSIWHYEQFLAQDSSDEKWKSDATVARMQLDECRQRYWGNLSVAQADQRELELKYRLLEQRNKELDSWIARLNRENASLRTALLSAQKSAGRK